MAVCSNSDALLRPKTKHFRARLVAGVICILLVIWSLFGVMTYGDYQSQWKRYVVFCENAAALLKQDISRNIELLDLSIKSASLDLNDPEIKRLPLDLQRKVLFSRAMNAPGLDSILVVNKSGGLVLESKGKAPANLNVADRDYFIAERTRIDQSLPFVSHPLKNRVSGMAGISFSRRRTALDGSFDGVVVGMITLDYFAQLFQLVQLPDGSSIALVHKDGTILMREPNIPGAVGKNFKSDDMFLQIVQSSSGIIVRKSLIDGVQRMYAFKQIGALPIFMLIGLPVSDFLHQWLFRSELIGSGFLTLSAMIVFLGLLLARELDRSTEAERELAKLAATDSLTQLANRRHFNDVLDAEWRRATREATSISLLMVDGDFFKAFNDTYGHVEGDQALRTIAATLERCVARPGDLVARFGGEEFVILLPRTDTKGAETIAQAIQRAMAATYIPHRGSPLGKLTVSIGVAGRRPTLVDHASEMIEAADAALYRAKADGRDRIFVDGRPEAHAQGANRTA